ALDAEKDPTTYGKMAEVAAILAEGRLKRGEPELTLETLSLLRRHREEVRPGLAFRPEIASRTLDRFAGSGSFPPLLGRMRQGDPIALRFAEALGDAAAKCLVDELKRIELTLHRVPLAQAISRMGPKAAAVLSDELQKSAVPTEALRLLEALPHAAPEE